ncbi:MAG: preprotein translocase subunit SecG, partial [Deltaproteobacteria bacterium]|nr:preprotein translocase subunit SecG [Deltaproteobacteria bacterium]
FLAQLTAIAATLFVITSISLSYFSSKSESALAKYSARKAAIEKKDAQSVQPVIDAGINVGSLTTDAGSASEKTTNENSEEKK